MINFSAISGIASAVFFAIPVVLQELRRKNYSNYKRQRKIASNRQEETESDKMLAAAAKKFMISDSIKWSRFDSLCVGLGLFFLCLSFILELVF